MGIHEVSKDPGQNREPYQAPYSLPDLLEGGGIVRGGQGLELHLSPWPRTRPLEDGLHTLR